MPVAYFPFTGEAYQPKMGLKPLAWENLLEFDDKYRDHLDLKRDLFRDHRSEVMRALPGTEPYCLELNQFLRAHALKFHPSRFRLEGSRFIVAETGESFSEPASGGEALEQISRWVQEDWCLLEPGAPFALVAGFVCFPSRWSLEEKVGKAPDAVHEYVPDYKAMLSAPTTNFMGKLTADRPMWRLNWTIHDSDKLFCPGPHASTKTLTSKNVVANCFLRVERQTIWRLPSSGAIAFSIRTHLNSLSEVIAEPGKQKVLYDSLVGLPDETAIYRGMGPFLAPLKEALRC